MRVFLKEKNEIDFFKNGFAKFQLLDANEVENIKNFYQEEIANYQNISGKGGFHTTSNTHNVLLVNKVDEFLKQHLIHKLKNHFVNCTYTICNYLVKEADQNSEVTPHQDWLLVDETKFTSFNIWICLDEANEKSGCLKIIPRSQQLNFSHRAEDIPRFFDPFKENITPYFVNIPTKPGECIVLNHSIIHGSVKNISGKKRISCVVGAYESGAELFFFKPSKNLNKILKYKISPNTFLSMGENYLPIKGVTSIEEVDLKLDIWSFEKFKQKMSM